MDKQLAPSHLPSWLVPTTTTTTTTSVAPSPEDTDFDPDNPPAESDWRLLATPEQLALIRDGSYAATKNRETLYEALFPAMLECVAAGKAVAEALGMSAMSIEYGRLMSWVKRNPERFKEYKYAQSVSAEVMFDQIIEIADAVNSPEEVDRSRERINARKHRIAVADRERFGDVRQQDVTVTINMVEAMREANERVERVIDVPSRVING